MISRLVANLRNRLVFEGALAPATTTDTSTTVSILCVSICDETSFSCISFKFALSLLPFRTFSSRKVSDRLIDRRDPKATLSI